MRALLSRLIIVLPAVLVIYYGAQMASRAGSGCARASEDRLALIGTVMLGLGLVGVVSAVLGRRAFGGAAVAIGIVLLVIGIWIALGCLR